jgi:riboflavin kinase/FMN adenylyltransferase
MANGTAVTIGTFDGVHIGHQAILTVVRRQAERQHLASLAYAFRVPPRLHTELGPGRCLLLPESLKVRTLSRFVDRVVPVSFPTVRDLSPAGFAERILHQQLRAELVVVGPSFRFGAERTGAPEVLRSLGERLGFSVVVVPPVLIDGEPVNSTRIRSLLIEGDIPRATALLGRPPVLIGDVTRGDQVGRRIGYPTANLAVDPHVLLPKHGVYVAHAFVGGRSDPVCHPGLLYVGTRPTLEAGRGRLRCEIHLLAPPGEELYDAQIEVHLLTRLRGDRTFGTLDELRRQIELDVDRAAETLLRFTESSPPIRG